MQSQEVFGNAFQTKESLKHSTYKPVCDRAAETCF